MVSPKELTGRTVRAVIPARLRGLVVPHLKAGYWCLTGSFFRQRIPETPPRSLLFLCQGNICRSPFAEQVAAAIAKASSRNDLDFSSAGLNVKRVEGSPDTAVQAAAAYNVDLAPHRSQPLTEELAGKYDLMVVMEAGQAGPACRKSGRGKRSVALLPRFDKRARRLYDQRAHRIEDPFGGDFDVFSSCYERITRSVRGLLYAFGMI